MDLLKTAVFDIDPYELFLENYYWDNVAYIAAVRLLYNFLSNDDFLLPLFIGLLESTIGNNYYYDVFLYVGL